MKLAILTQPHDLFCAKIDTKLQELNIERALYMLGKNVSTPQVEWLFPKSFGTPTAYVDGRYIEDILGYINGTFDPDDPLYQGWTNNRLSDVIVVVTDEDYEEASKEIIKYMVENNITFREIVIDETAGPSRRFIYDFFDKTSSNEISFPVVIINGEMKENWKEYLESEEYQP